MLIKVNEPSDFVKAYFSIYSKTSEVHKIIESQGNYAVGELVVDPQKTKDGVYLEFIGVYPQERGKGYGRWATEVLKKRYQNLYGRTIVESKSFWNHLGVSYLDSIEKQFKL